MDTYETTTQVAENESEREKDQIRVLVIEDEIDLCIDIVEMLSLESYHVESANEGATGIAKAIKTPPDIILCDIMMPQVNGYQVLQTLRAYPTTRLTPFIFMTAKASRRDIRMGMEMGADDYLTKPFSYDELLQALGTQLAKAEAISKAQTAHVDKLRHLIARSLPHEFRTPLTTILGFSDLMVRDAQEDSNDELLVRASQIFSAGKRLHRLVENYLLYTELSMIPPNGDQTAYTFNIHNYERTDDICKEAEAVAETFKRSDDLTCRVHDKAIPIDNAVMVKIVHELMRNAFAHSEPDDEVSLTTRQENDEFILQVQDRGHGMMPEQIKEIGAYVQFNRQFYEQQGVGLGLAIVRQLVRLSQGRLHIDSEEGVGTTVTIAYPLTESEA